MVQEGEGAILVVLWITPWMQEFVEGPFVIVRKSEFSVYAYIQPRLIIKLLKFVCLPLLLLLLLISMNISIFNEEIDK